MARWLGLCGADWHERSGVGDSCITMPLLLPLLLLRGWPVAPSLARIVCVGVGGGRDLPESSRWRRRGVLGALWAADLQGGFSRGSDLTSPFRALSATLENALMGVGWGEWGVIWAISTDHLGGGGTLRGGSAHFGLLQSWPSVSFHLAQLHNCPVP